MQCACLQNVDKKIAKVETRWDERLSARWTLCRRSWMVETPSRLKMSTDSVAACVRCLPWGTPSTGSPNGHAREVPSAASGLSSGEWIPLCHRLRQRLESRNRAYRRCFLVSWRYGSIRTMSATDSVKTEASVFYSTKPSLRNRNHLARGTFLTAAETSCWSVPIWLTLCQQLLRYRQNPFQCQHCISSSNCPANELHSTSASDTFNGDCHTGL